MKKPLLTLFTFAFFFTSAPAALAAMYYSPGDTCEERYSSTVVHPGTCHPSSCPTGTRSSTNSDCGIGSSTSGTILVKCCIPTNTTANGGLCYNSSECVSGYCNTTANPSVCAPMRYSNNMMCDADNQCVSNYCTPASSNSFGPGGPGRVCADRPSANAISCGSGSRVGVCKTSCNGSAGETVNVAGACGTSSVCCVPPAAAAPASGAQGPSGSNNNNGSVGPSGPNGNTSGDTTLLNPLSGGGTLQGFLMGILDFVIRIGTIAIVLMLILVGYRFVAAQGAPSKIEEARSTLLWTVVGALILLGAKAIALGIEATVQAISAGH